MKEIATIRNDAVFNRWGNVEPKVVLTEERIAHIREGHAQDYADFGKYIGKVIESPTYILEDHKNASTAFFVKYIRATNVNVVVRLRVGNADADDLRSSVITMYRLGDKTLSRLLKRNKLLYKAPPKCYNTDGETSK